MPDTKLTVTIVRPKPAAPPVAGGGAPEGPLRPGRRGMEGLRRLGALVVVALGVPVLALADPGWRSQWEKDHVMAQFEEARQIYRKFALEATSQMKTTSTAASKH